MKPVDLKIVFYPHPALRWSSKPVAQVSEAVRQLATGMLELMHQAQGLGLAANQVAVPIRLFVTDASVDPLGEGKDRVYINPEILDREGIVVAEEGCLSLPGIYADVRRAQRVRVRALDAWGNSFEVEAPDLAARVLQHEWDHLRGVLFIDRVHPSVKLKLLPQLRTLERNYRHEQLEGRIPSNQLLVDQLRAVQATFAL
jgi:peptide deformylase